MPHLPRSGFPDGSEVKASACNVGDLSSIPGSGRFPWRKKWQPTPVFLPGESHGQRSLMGYSPRGHKESDTTERLHFHFNNLNYSFKIFKTELKIIEILPQVGKNYGRRNPEGGMLER